MNSTAVNVTATVGLLLGAQLTSAKNGSSNASGSGHSNHTHVAKGVSAPPFQPDKHQQRHRGLQQRPIPSIPPISPMVLNPAQRKMLPDFPHPKSYFTPTHVRNLLEERVDYSNCTPDEEEQFSEAIETAWLAARKKQASRLGPHSNYMDILLLFNHFKIRIVEKEKRSTEKETKAGHFNLDTWTIRIPKKAFQLSPAILIAVLSHESRHAFERILNWWVAINHDRPGSCSPFQRCTPYSDFDTQVHYRAVLNECLNQLEGLLKKIKHHQRLTRKEKGFLDSLKTVAVAQIGNPVKGLPDIVLRGLVGKPLNISRPEGRMVAVYEENGQYLGVLERKTSSDKALVTIEEILLMKKKYSTNPTLWDTESVAHLTAFPAHGLDAFCPSYGGHLQRRERYLVEKLRQEARHPTKKANNKRTPPSSRNSRGSRSGFKEIIDDGYDAYKDGWYAAYED